MLFRNLLFDVNFVSRVKLFDAILFNILSLIFQNFLFVVDIFISIHIVDLWYNPFKTQSNRVLISINHIITKLLPF